MAKTKISEFSATPANNTDIDSINIAEGCAPSGINDAIRELMAQLKDFQTGAVGDSFNGPVGSSTAAAGAFTTLSASSTLAVTGVATLTAQPILSSLTASRAVFTDASKGLVSNAITGTGNVVMSASPTLTGTVGGASLTLSSLTAGRVTYAGTSGLLQDDADLTFDGTTLSTAGLTASSTVTLSGGTANGVAYLNGSKVLTSGSALQFDGSQLLVNSNSTTASGFFQINDSTTTQANSFGTIVRNANDGNGRYSLSAWRAQNASGLTQYAYIGAQSISGASNYTPELVFGLSTGASTYAEQMRLTSTGLGIGTSSPSQKLVVSGSGAQRFDIVDTGGATGRVSTAGGVVYVGTTTNHPLAFFTNDAEKMRLDSAGNLGLGVTPSAWGSFKAVELPNGVYLGSFTGGTNAGYLGVNNYFNGSNYIYKNTDYATRYQQSVGEHQFFTAPSGTAGNDISFTQAMTLNSSGNLGVGTTSPTQRLDVYGTGMKVNNASYVGYLGAGNTFAGGAASDFCVRSDNVLSFATNGPYERARIDSSGNLLVGKTATSFSTLGAEMRATGQVLSAMSGSTNTTETLNVYSTGASVQRFYVGLGGTIYATSTSISAISDATLKENVRNLETGLTEVMALRPRRFDWKNGDAQNVAGFVAQEVEQVLPELVTDYRYKTDNEGNDIIKKSLKMGDILPTLVNAIQEQQAIIESLKARLDAANL